MNECWISLGSNYESAYNFKQAHNLLTELFNGITWSPAINTKPVGINNPAFFLNQVGYFKSEYSKKKIVSLLKAIELRIGRRDEDKAKEIVRIDLDLLIYNEDYIKREDLERDYVQKGIREINMSKKALSFVGIIPARYASTRFPAKPLAFLGGKQVIQHVYEQVSKVLDAVYVATDDQRIVEAVEAFGGKVVMTSSAHKSGTDRCREAVDKIGKSFDVVINIQGDEPFIQPSQLKTLMECFSDIQTQIATLVKPFSEKSDWKDLQNANSPKVVIDSNDFALYFSRSVIPYIRGEEQEKWLNQHVFYKHIGLYAYRLEVLNEITSLPQSSLELAESLEQLRWIENGYKIKVGKTNVETIGIDTPEDLEKAEKHLEQINKKEA